MDTFQGMVLYLFKNIFESFFKTSIMLILYICIYIHVCVCVCGNKDLLKCQINSDFEGIQIFSCLIWRLQNLIFRLWPSKT